MLLLKSIIIAGNYSSWGVIAIRGCIYCIYREKLNYAAAFEWYRNQFLKDFWLSSDGLPANKPST
jgi:hypothetical protein